MKKLVVLSLIIFFVAIHVSWNKKADTVLDSLRPWIVSELENAKDKLVLSNKNLTDLSKLQKFYLNSRKHYKHVEFFVEYCSPMDGKYMINGPLVPKHDPEMGNVIISPMGYQSIEELLYDDFELSDTIELKRQYQQLIAKMESLISYYKDIQLEDGQLLEMCQLQLFRITSLNLNGYDATFIKNNVQESGWSIEGIEKVVQCFKPLAGKHKESKTDYFLINEKLNDLQKSLAQNRDYDSFNRLDFITEQVIPLNKLFVQFHQHVGLSWNNRKQALNLQQGSLFKEASFNLRFFSMYYQDTINLVSQANLGKILFFDPILSGNNQRSCASCHNPQKAFTDGFERSVGMTMKDIKLRNAPSLIDVAFQQAFFWDGRTYQLEQQAFDVVHNKSEMGGNLEDIVVKLKRSNEYKTLFANAFKRTSDTVITTYSIQKALTEYEKTLVSFNSRFDKYLNGERLQLNLHEINGYNLFAGKALCGSCHFFPVFNGTVPPFYSDSEFEILGVPSTKENNAIDKDFGRYEVTKLEEHRSSFKTPTVRNSELTAPYMHNGVYDSFDQVLDFYHRGGGKGFGYFVGQQTLPFDSLILTNSEKEDIILFMKSLSDTSGLTSKPQRLPQFEDTDLNHRTVGGSY